MNEPVPELPSPGVHFRAILITRGGGAGAKRFMEEHPEREAFILTFAPWQRVESGSLTLDHAKPLPLPALQDVVPLALEPADLLRGMTQRDARISAMRGAPAYYGGIIRAGEHSRPVILSQQPRPACEHRLEILADVYLRKPLQVTDGDVLAVDVYEGADWHGIMGMDADAISWSSG